MLRLRSTEIPFDDLSVAGQAARLLSTAEALGLWEPQHVVSQLDAEVFDEAIGAIAAVGVATSAPFDWQPMSDKPAADFGEWIASIRDVLRTSPIPERELPRLDGLFGTDRLAELVGTATSSLRRYLSHDRKVPDDVAARGHVIALIVGDLAGSYNDRGIRRWFERPRAQLDGLAPSDILSDRWDPDAPDVARVLALSGERSG
jgi:hypothetical protein